MNNVDHKTDSQCPDRTWCDRGHHEAPEHIGSADLPTVTATADRTAYVAHGAGVLVPEVLVHLYEETAPTTSVERYVVVTTHTPAAKKRSSEVCLTLDEADLLLRHLTQLLVEVGR